MDIDNFASKVVKSLRTQFFHVAGSNDQIYLVIAQRIEDRSVLVNRCGMCGIGDMQGWNVCLASSTQGDAATVITDSNDWLSVELATRTGIDDCLEITAAMRRKNTESSHVAKWGAFRARECTMALVKNAAKLLRTRRLFELLSKDIFLHLTHRVSG